MSASLDFEEKVQLDYSLTGLNSARAVEKGLAEAEWYTSPVPKAEMRRLLSRSDGPALRDTALLVALLAITGAATIYLWGTWWAVVPYLIYAVLYGTSSDSRWHECGHGTAFKTDWMNSVLYEIASFMVMRESVVWRWSHNRHHSDTIIVGRDPEIQIPRPPNLRALALSIFNISGYQNYYPSLLRHALGKMTDAERTFVPQTEWPKVFGRARICLFLYGLVIASSAVLQSWLPIFLFILPQFFGTWLMIVHNTTQHAGLAENVLDHRLNCRTVYMNPISRFIYWNMNYHVEHHMFPLVPYHALPRLHRLVRDDCPPPYPSILSAWREILPTLRRQVTDAAYHVRRQLPPPRERADRIFGSAGAQPDDEGWIEVCPEDQLAESDVVRFDHGRKTYAISRDAEGNLFAIDGICTHGNTHLADGLVIGGTIECPKHNGRFNLSDGSPARAPVCRGVRTYPVKSMDGKLRIHPGRPGGAGIRSQKSLKLRVVSNQSVSTFIKELILEPAEGEAGVDFSPGDYLQIEIPEYGKVAFRDFHIPEPYAEVWRRNHLFDLVGLHPGGLRRNNYSLACNSRLERVLRFNVRIATPPPGQDCAPGIGSSYIFSLRPGDTVTAIGPFGDFHIKPTQREMIYIGGGAGMAPIRAHLSHLFESENSQRRVSYWYGARSRQEIFYEPYFQQMAADHGNFRFNVALSQALPEDGWTGLEGMIHEVIFKHYLKTHPNLRSVEFYLCGPPQMIKACRRLLAELGVSELQVAFDEF